MRPPVAINCCDQATASARDITRPSRVERDDTHRPQHRDPASGPPADGSRRRGSRGEVGNDECRSTAANSPEAQGGRVCAPVSTVAGASRKPAPSI